MMNIVVCLSRDRSLFSNVTYLADGGGYTHASLGLDEDAEFYYSFNFKGLKKEYRTSLKKKPREMQRYILTVPDEAGYRLKELLAEMEAQKEKYQYAKLGVSLRLLNLPNDHPQEDKYYCSQFVAAVLKASGCMDIKKEPADCTPNDLLKEMTDSGQICRIEEESDLVNPGESVIGLAVDGLEKGHDKLADLAVQKAEDLFDGEGRLIPALALGIGMRQLNPLYKKLLEKLEIAEDAVGDAPEKLAGLTGGLLKSGSEKLIGDKTTGK